MPVVGVLLLAGLACVTVDARYLNRVWTYQSTNRVQAMGMGYGVSYSMIGRGRHDMAMGRQEIYDTTDADGNRIALPSTIWVGSCVYETEEDGFVRCINRKTPIYNINTNKPICTDSPIPLATVLVPDEYCENSLEILYQAPYDPADPSKTADFNGDKYGNHLSMAGDLELGRILAIGAPKTFDSDGTPFNTPNTFYDSYGAVYTYTGEYKHWTEHQRLTADDANVVLTDNKPDYGTRVEIDRVSSRTMFVSCPQCTRTDRPEGSVYVYRTEDGKYWSNTQQLICDDAESDTWEFSKNMRLYDEFALISAAALTQLGAAYIFREERHSTYKGGIYNGLWTQQQRLRPTDAYIASSGNLYGEKMDLWGKTLVITQNRQKTHGTNSGVAYIYESHKTLEYTDTDWIETDDGHRRLHPKAKPKPMHKWWSQVQALYPSDPHEYRLFGDEVSIWGDVISIMGGGDGLVDAGNGAWADFDYEPVAGYKTFQTGSVYMFTRSRSNRDTWTQQQKLYNPDLNDGLFFSNSVDDLYQGFEPALKDNRFGLPRLHGSWMQITSSSQAGYMFTDTVDWHCLLITVGDGMGDGWDRARLVATAPTDPRTREVKHDTYSQYCDAYNYEKVAITIPSSRKLQEMYRYCPLSPEDEGDYVFEIMGNPRGKKGDKGTPSDDLYWREIYWDIYNEFDGKRYIGDAHTKLTFNWGREDFFFTEKKVERLYKAPDVCSQCNVWDGIQKAKPKRRAQSTSAVKDEGDFDASRRLNLYPTPAPTNTMSPTLAWDDKNSWDQWMFVMGRNESRISSGYGSTTAWVDKYKNGTATMFYIYDSNGLNITEPLIWGQLCTLTGTIQDSCTTQDLPVGGTYTLRVTGGMDYRRHEIQWKFCNVIGHAMESLVFTKYSSTCLPIAHYGSEDLCEKQGFIVYTSSQQVLKGMYGLYSENRDNAIVEAALKTMLHPYVVSKISIVVEEESLQGTSEDVVIRADIQFDSNLNKISVTDLDGLHNFETALVEKLAYYDDNRLIASMLSSAAHDLLGSDTPTVMSGVNFESHVTNFEIIKAEPKKLKLFRERVHTTTYKSVDPDDDEQPQTSNAKSTKVKMDDSTQLEYNILNAEAIGGYVMMTCILVAMVLVSWRRRVKSRQQIEQLGEPLEADDHLILQSSWSQSSTQKKSKKSKGDVRVEGDV